LPAPPSTSSSGCSEFRNSYLADAFPEAGLAPETDDPARGTYYRWLFFTAGCVEAAVMDKAFDRELPEKKGSVGYGSYEDTIDALETALEPGPWILGSAFSAADVYVGSQVSWGLKFGTIDQRDTFSEYVTRCTARPAYQRAEEHAESLLG
jgi:glutathione S-transferase